MRFILKEIWHLFLTVSTLFLIFASVVFVAFQNYSRYGKSFFYDLVNGYFFSVLMVIISGTLIISILWSKNKLSHERAGSWFRIVIYALAFLIFLGYTVSNYLIA